MRATLPRGFESRADCVVGLGLGRLVGTGIIYPHTVPDYFDAPRDARKALLSSFQEDYSRADTQWRTLESKAQAAIPVAGIFAGFALNYAKELQATASWSVRTATVVTVVLLAVSVTFAAIALKVRELANPPDGKFFRQLSEDYADLDAGAKCEYLPELEKYVIGEWERATNELRVANERKAEHVERSQIALLGAIAAAAVLATLTAVNPKPLPTTTPQPSPTIYEVHQERLSR
jgi:hypothetical protein